MYKASILALRYRTAWRELLHPLPIAARHDQWLKRDTVEMNEAVLRIPYYKIKSHQTTTLPGAVAPLRESTHDGMVKSANQDNDASFDSVGSRSYRHGAGRGGAPLLLPERLAALREQLNLSASGTHGPVPPPPTQRGGGQRGGSSFVEEYGFRLRPRYPQSWDAVPPDQPSRN